MYDEGHLFVLLIESKKDSVSIKDKTFAFNSVFMLETFIKAVIYPFMPFRMDIESFSNAELYDTLKRLANTNDSIASALTIATTFIKF